MGEGDPVDLVRQVRLYRLGRNPFVPVIMTSWHSDGEFVQRVVDGGVDVLVTKPFAAGQLFARINFLVNARPPFVAAAGGACANADREWIFGLIGKMGIEIPGEPDIMIGDDANEDTGDVFIESDAVA